MLSSSDINKKLEESYCKFSLADINAIKYRPDLLEEYIRNGKIDISMFIENEELVREVFSLAKYSSLPQVIYQALKSRKIEPSIQIMAIILKSDHFPPGEYSSDIREPLRLVRLFKDIYADSDKFRQALQTLDSEGKQPLSYMVGCLGSQIKEFIDEFKLDVTVQNKPSSTREDLRNYGLSHKPYAKTFLGLVVDQYLVKDVLDFYKPRWDQERADLITYLISKGAGVAELPEIFEYRKAEIIKDSKTYGWTLVDLSDQLTKLEDKVAFIKESIVVATRLVLTEKAKFSDEVQAEVKPEQSALKNSFLRS